MQNHVILSTLRSDIIPAYIESFIFTIGTFLKTMTKFIVSKGQGLDSFLSSAIEDFV